MSKEELTKVMQENNGFAITNGFELEEYEDGKSATLKVTLTEKSLNPYGFAHGGLIFGLGDNAMGVVARTTGRSAVTLSSNISYLKPVSGKYLIAKAEMIKNGKTTAYLRTDFYNDKKALVATMDANYYYVD